MPGILGLGPFSSVPGGNRLSPATMIKIAGKVSDKKGLKIAASTKLEYASSGQHFVIGKSFIKNMTPENLRGLISLLSGEQEMFGNDVGQKIDEIFKVLEKVALRLRGTSDIKISLRGVLRNMQIGGYHEKGAPADAAIAIEILGLYPGGRLRVDESTVGVAMIAAPHLNMRQMDNLLKNWPINNSKFTLDREEYEKASRQGESIPFSVKLVSSYWIEYEFPDDQKAVLLTAFSMIGADTVSLKMEVVERLRLLKRSFDNIEDPKDITAPVEDEEYIRDFQ